MTARLVLAGSFLLAVGCVTGPTSSPLVVSSTANQYVLPTSIQIVARNHGDAPLFLNPCFDMEQRLAGGSWQNIGPLGVCVYGAMWVLQPGLSDTSEAYFISAPGIYRVGISYATDSLFTHQKVSFSNEFSVVQGPLPLGRRGGD
jgi:hypothetical protein